jgi:DNA-binding response OmpR family regulator
MDAEPVPIRVLIADDYVALHRAITRLLQPACDVVGSVTDVTHLVAETVRLQPDVVVLDLRMVGVDGLDVCGQLRNASPGVQILLYSAAEGPDLRGYALAAGAADFIVKTRVTEELLPAIQRAVRSERPASCK